MGAAPLMDAAPRQWRAEEPSSIYYESERTKSEERTNRVVGRTNSVRRTSRVHHWMRHSLFSILSMKSMCFTLVLHCGMVFLS